MLEDLKNKKQNWADTAVDVKNYIYVLLVMTVCVLILHNSYYDITKTRYTWFVGISCVFIVTSVLLTIVVYTLRIKSVKTSVNELSTNLPLHMLALFLCANIVACFMGRSLESVGSDGKLSAHAFYGDNGRLMGLAMYLILCLVVAFLAKRYRGFDSLYVVLAVVILFVMILALVQHTGVDAFSLKQGIKSNQYDKFITTMGNINIFASFIVIANGVTFGAYIYGSSASGSVIKRVCFKILYGVVLFVCGMAIMTANSDSAYLGLAVIIIFAAVSGVYNNRLRAAFEAALIFFLGNLCTVVWHTKMDSYPNYGGLSHKLDDVKVASAIVIAFAILYVISILVESRLTRGDEDKIRKNKRVLVITGVAVVLLGITAFVLYGIKSGDSLFRFNYKWGTYRGYIWAKCAETFKNAPIANKLFGYGNETIKQVVTVPNYDDMVEKTSRIYDNAHNEVLQYLLTLGLFGALSYIALVVSSIWYMCRYGSKNLHTYIPAFVVCGYFVQGLVNLNQPITTPLFFVFLGVGIGYASYCKNH